MRLGFYILDVPVRYTIKNTVVRGPLGYLLRKTGAVAIARERPNANRSSYTDMMTDIITSMSRVAMIITPEGTRSKTTQWKTGFYYVAKNTNVPIALGYLDYERKVAGIGMIINPTNIEDDMKLVMEFYRSISPKISDRFALDERYV